MILVAAKETESNLQIDLKLDEELVTPQWYMVAISSCCGEEHKLHRKSRTISCKCGRYTYSRVPFGRDRFYFSENFKEETAMAQWIEFWTGLYGLEVSIKW